MNKSNSSVKTSLKDQVEWNILIPGGALLLLLTVVALFFGSSMQPYLDAALTWTINHLQFLWIAVTLVMVAILLWLMISKYGDVVIGGKNAKPIMSTWTWVCMAITGGIAVGICFFGVAGPLSYFLNPPTFLGVEGGTPEAIIPAFTWTYVNWALGPYAFMAMGGLILAFAYFNLKRECRAGSTMYVAFGRKREKLVSTILDSLLVALIIGFCNNYSLAATQLSAGLKYVFGLNVSVEALVILYSIVAIIIVCTRGHSLMGKVSTINMWMYLFILVVALLLGPTNRLIGTLFESLGEYLTNFIPLTTFSDVAMQTHWLDTETIYYYSWTLGSIFGLGLFMSLLGRGRTIRQFIIVNWICPCALVCTWFSVFGGTAIYQYMDGNTFIADTLATLGSGYATFAFLDTLPGGKIWLIFYLVMAVFTFLTNADALIFSQPKLFLKGDRVTNDSIAPPKPFAIANGLLTAFLTVGLLKIGGMDAVGSAMILFTLPVIILTFIAMYSLVKALLQRKKYDATYIEECMDNGTWTAEDEAAADPGIMEAIHAERG